jgi:hypothetical protein
MPACSEPSPPPSGQRRHSQRGCAADPKPTSINLEKPIAQVAVKTPPMTRDCIMPPANNQNRSDRNSDLMNKTG